MLSDMRRGAAASAWLGQALAGQLPIDTALSHLGPAPGVGWLDLLADARATGAIGVRLFLPRPGDPRGQRSPDPAAATAPAVLGWIGSGVISAWTTVTDEAPWSVRSGPSISTTLPTPAEANRDLRAAILRTADDLAALDQHVESSGIRNVIARELTAWSDVPLDGDRAALAARAVPLLLASVSAPEVGISAHAQRARQASLLALDPVVRTCVEVAYSYPVAAAP